LLAVCPVRTGLVMVFIDGSSVAPFFRRWISEVSHRL
jgi:hypothetical protein